MVRYLFFLSCMTLAASEHPLFRYVSDSSVDIEGVAYELHSNGDLSEINVEDQQALRKLTFLIIQLWLNYSREDDRGCAARYSYQVLHKNFYKVSMLDFKAYDYLVHYEEAACPYPFDDQFIPDAKDIPEIKEPPEGLKEALIGLGVLSTVLLVAGYTIGSFIRSRQEVS